MHIKRTTLLFIMKNDQILLAEKKRGFGVGLFNGIGGKIEPGETIEQAMIRETQEEIGVTPLNTTHVATITFKLGGFDATEQEITSVFVANDFEGKIIETEEMRPAWYHLDQIPYNKMFSADKIWLPTVIKGNKFNGEVVFDPDFNVLDTALHIIDQ